MIGELTNHLWQSTLFALVPALLTVAFRNNRAEVRWLWFSASFKFLIPFSLLMGLGSHVAWRPVAKSVSAPSVSFTLAQLTQPFPRAVALLSPAAATSFDWLPLAFLGVWLCGFASIALIRFRDWRRIRAAVHLSTPFKIPAPVEVRSSPSLLEPGVVGLFHPILLLPAGIIDRLTPPQLNAVLAHELSHVRRHDNLTSATHMIVEAIFWFHPLVWWIGSRLMEERERACDEEVLSLGSEPRVYAEGILNVCKLYTESPLTCVSGVTGSNLKKRLRAIMAGHVPAGLNLPSKLALGVAALGSLVAPIVAGLMNPPLMLALSPTKATPKFEVAAIKPCKVDPAPGRPRKKDGGWSPGSFRSACQTVTTLIEEAYVSYANGHTNIGPYVPIAGSPAWVNSDHYQINAKAESPQSLGMMIGPMLQALLEDRFKLKIHREAREVPVYALAVAKGRLKLQPFKEGSCIPPDDFDHLPPPKPDQPFPLICGMSRFTNNGFDAYGVTMANLSSLLSGAGHLDRPVIDKTGITGMFNIHLDLDAADLGYPIRRQNDLAAPPTSTDPDLILVAVNTAVRKLGLNLKPSKGPGEFLVIDHVERPSAN